MATGDRPQRLGELGAFIRAQRRLAELSQRELARITDLSDAYVSQLERGMHEPTVKVLRSIAQALDIRAQTMLTYAGWLEQTEGDADDETAPPATEVAIRADPRLTETQKRALLSVYRGFLEPGPDG
jgi:transcriptional regulator with XRE-family HTH domain